MGRTARTEITMIPVASNGAGFTGPSNSTRRILLKLLRSDAVPGTKTTTHSLFTSHGTLRSKSSKISPNTTLSVEHILSKSQRRPSLRATSAEPPLRLMESSTTQAPSSPPLLLRDLSSILEVPTQPRITLAFHLLMRRSSQLLTRVASSSALAHLLKSFLTQKTF